MVVHEEMNNPFAKSKDQPQSEPEEKWGFVGFFSGFFFTFITLIPLWYMANSVSTVVEMSPFWFILLIGIIVWCFTILLGLRWWLRLAHNFGLFMYKLGQENEKEQQKK